MPLPDIFTKKPDALVRTLMKSGWSQEDIAENVGTTQATISRIVSGLHKDPRYTLVDKIRALVIDLDDFDQAVE